MKPRSFAALAVITAFAVAIALTTYAAHNRWSQAKVSGAALFPGLGAQAGRIASIDIKQGDKALTLARDKDAWSVADRGGYPAKPDAVRALLVKLAGAELVESKTRNKDRYALLELEDPSGKDAKSRLLRVLDDKGGVIARPCSARSASMRSAATRAAPMYARQATSRPGSATPTSIFRSGCGTGCRQPSSTWPRPRSPR